MNYHGTDRFRGNEPAQLASDLKRKAFELGFSKTGITKPGALTAEGERLREWITRGFVADMHWLQRTVQMREDTASVFPGVRTAIALAHNYFSGHKHPSGRDFAKVSRYAWGDDYHSVLNNKLGVLEEFLHARVPGCTTRRYVDTGPIMEKALAVRSGIGWLGKHTNVITREYGSWVFLSEILTDIELPSDEPANDFCGSCLACIEACPTKAIVEPYVLDSRRCISYLTIESKGEIPEEYAAQLENWIFGCDICQEVCPWNSFETETGEPRFGPRNGSLSLRIAEVSEMTDDDFRRRFRGSAVKRAKVTGLRRNSHAIMRARRG